jgi:ATP-dependent Lhr-like helicase
VPDYLPSWAFDLLHPGIQKWIWRERWGELRDVQERATRPILAADTDVMIAAPTAGGKTEAAFLPILTRIADGTDSVGVLCVSPLKALINDQFLRLEEMTAAVGLSVCRWHGDVGEKARRELLTDPSGVLLITPESLEAMFVLRAQQLPELFGDLRYVVIDEVHSFIGSERGRQLQSLLHRLSRVTGVDPPRVALSATLGDMLLACEFLRPGAGERVTLIEAREGGQELKLQLRGYRLKEPDPAEDPEADGDDDWLDRTDTGDDLDVCRDLFKHLRGHNNLVYANARMTVEKFADVLRRLSEKRRVPNEFWPHHGNLSKELREEAEAAVKNPGRPATVVCTTTLELGIDIGAVASVAQIGPPPSVASMRQRLGRSGRRGEPAVMRMYIQERGIDERTPPQDQLREQVVQSIAMVNLLLRGWFEPPVVGALHLSTLVQQLLSTIAERGGVWAKDAYDSLCGTGPFTLVTPAMFADLLRSMGAKELIAQMHTGELVLGPKGERIVDHYSFYAAFATPEEYRVVAGGRTLGTLPIDRPFTPGDYLVFAGRRWRVLDISDEQKTIQVERARGGRVPHFGGSGAAVHGEVRKEMLAVYKSRDDPSFLDATARGLLQEARDNFARLGLGTKRVIPYGDGSLVFLWAGDRAAATLALMLKARDYDAGLEGLAIRVYDAQPDPLLDTLRSLLGGPPPDAVDLAAVVLNKRSQKYDWVLDEALLSEDYAARALDVHAALGVASRVVAPDQGA